MGRSSRSSAIAAWLLVLTACGDDPATQFGSVGSGGQSGMPSAGASGSAGLNAQAGTGGRAGGGAAGSAGTLASNPIAGSGGQAGAAAGAGAGGGSGGAGGDATGCGRCGQCSSGRVRPSMLVGGDVEVLRRARGPRSRDAAGGCDPQVHRQRRGGETRRGLVDDRDGASGGPAPRLRRSARGPGRESGRPRRGLGQRHLPGAPQGREPRDHRDREHDRAPARRCQRLLLAREHGARAGVPAGHRAGQAHDARAAQDRARSLRRLPRRHQGRLGRATSTKTASATRTASPPPAA